MVWMILLGGCSGDGTTPNPVDAGSDSAIDDGGPMGVPPAKPIHGWILLEDDPDVVARTIEAAARYGVNHIQLSHDLIMNIDDVLDGSASATERIALLEQAAKLADDRGMDTYVWAHELSQSPLDVCYEPGGEVWAARAEAYRAAFAAMPHVDGAVMMFGSSPVPVWGTLCTCAWCADTYPGTSAFLAPPNDERIRLVTEQVGGVVVNELGKGLLMRTFVHNPQENEWHVGGLSRARGVEFYGMHKSEVQDWQPYNPPDPTMGMAERRYAVVEMDAAGEYYGTSELPFCAPGYFRYRLRHARENLGVGAVVRVERGGSSALGTPNEINLLSIAMLLDNPDAALDTIWDQFLAEHFGLAPGEAGQDTLRRVLETTFTIRLASHYVLGIWALEKSSDIPAGATLDQFRDRGKMPKWDADWQPLWDELDTPDTATVLAIWQEASEAIALAAESVDDVATLESILAPASYADLQRRIAHQLRSAAAWRDVKLFIWADLALRKGDGNPALAGWLRWAHEDLSAIADTMEQEGLSDVNLASPARIRTFVDNTVSRVDGAVPASPPPQALFAPVRTLAVTSSSATLEVATTSEAEVELDYGLEVPDFGEIVDLGTLAPGAARVVTLEGLEPGRRYVVRLRASVGGTVHRGGYHWVFTE